MTAGAGAGVDLVRPDDIVVIAQDVWSSFLDMQLERAGDVPAQADPDDAGPGAMTGVIEVMDAWHGSVVLECSAGMARTVAASMFREGADPLTPDDVVDALGELTNMIGGNIKSLLPAPSRLSLPSVRSGGWPWDGSAGTLVSSVELASPTGDRVHISVWKG